MLTLDSQRQYRGDGGAERRPAGRLEVARTKERMEELQRRMSSAERSWEMEGSPGAARGEIRELITLSDEEVKLAGFFCPGRCRRLTRCGLEQSYEKERRGLGALQNHGQRRRSSTLRADGRRVRGGGHRQRPGRGRVHGPSLGVWSPQSHPDEPGDPHPPDSRPCRFIDVGPDTQSLREIRGKSSRIPSCGTWTPSCTSGRHQARWRSAPTPIARYSTLPDEIPSIFRGTALFTDPNFPFTLTDDRLNARATGRCPRATCPTSSLQHRGGKKKSDKWCFSLSPPTPCPSSVRSVEVRNL